MGAQTISSEENCPMVRVRVCVRVSVRVRVGGHYSSGVFALEPIEENQITK